MEDCVKSSPHRARSECIHKAHKHREMWTTSENKTRMTVMLIRAGHRTAQAPREPRSSLRPIWCSGAGAGEHTPGPAPGRSLRDGRTGCENVGGPVGPARSARGPALVRGARLLGIRLGVSL